jgi:uncharacterized protein (TIGR00106 family)
LRHRKQGNGWALPLFTTNSDYPWKKWKDILSSLGKEGYSLGDSCDSLIFPFREVSMSVLLELTMFPTDKGESVSPYVARIIEMIDSRGITYQLTPMGTIMEFDEVGQALRIVTDACGLLEKDCSRIYVTMKLDIRKGRSEGLTGKIASVETRLGRKLHT